MRTPKFNPQISRHFLSIILLALSLFCSASLASAQDWPDERCEAITTRLKLLEGQDEAEAAKRNVRSAPLIRQEIATLEKELTLLQAFQKGGQYAQISTIVNHVPMLATAVVGSLAGINPVFAEKLVQGTGELLGYVNQREIRVRQTELPRLREEQIEVGRQIFLLRESAESLKCNQRGSPVQLIIGKWRAADTGNVIEFDPNGSGFLRELGGASTTFGFNPGDAVFTDIREVEGNLAARMIIRASKQDCAALEPVTVNATIKFAADNRTFTLSAPGYNYCTTPCKWASGEGDISDRTYTRAD